MSELPPDTLNEIGVLRRREIEARILMPVLERLGAEFGKERVFAIARDVIIDLAREQGRELARQMGGDDLGRFAAALENWKKGDAYQMDTLESTPERLSFNVHKPEFSAGSQIIDYWGVLRWIVPYFVDAGVPTIGWFGAAAPYAGFGHAQIRPC